MEPGSLPLRRNSPSVFRCGIAEQHGVTFAQGLPPKGSSRCSAVYSSFLQRAYDQVFHDVCLQNLPVVFAIDRAGVVGSDGPTHHGLFDISYLRTLPNLTIMAPKDENELQHMLQTAIDLGAPAAVRYPAATVSVSPSTRRSGLFRRQGRGPARREGWTILALGTMVFPALEAASLLATEGVEMAVVNARFVKPLDRELILTRRKRAGIFHRRGKCPSGGFGTAVLELLAEEGYADVAVKRLGFPDCYIEQGEQPELRARHGLDATGIAARVREVLKCKPG